MRGRGLNYFAPWMQKPGKREISRRLFACYAPSEPAAARRAAGQAVKLEPHLLVTNVRNNVSHWLEFRVGEERLYVLKNVLEFIYKVKGRGVWPLGVKSALDFDCFHWADEVSAELYELLEGSRVRENAWLGQMRSHGRFYGAGTMFFEGKQFKLGEEQFARFLEIMEGHSFELTLESVVHRRDARVVRGNPALELEFSRTEQGGGLLRLAAEASLAKVDGSERYYYREGAIYHVDEAFRQHAAPLLRAYGGESEIELEPEDVARFFSLVLPRVQQVAEVRVDEAFEQNYVFEPLACELYLDYEGDGLSVRPVFAYGSTRFNPLAEEYPAMPRGQKLVRDESGEREIFARLANYGFEKQRGSFVQLDEERSYDFLVDELPELPDWVEVFYEDAFRQKPVRPMPKVTAGVSINDQNLLEVSFNARDLDFDEMMDILESYRQKRRYHRLRDRTFVTLGEQQLSALADFVESTGLTKKKIRDGEKAVLPLAQAMYIDQLAREADTDLSLRRSQKFRQLVRNIRSPQDADYEVPESLTGILRDYQVTGFNWLSGLAACGLGGILADDMGLGKTLQVLAFLLSEKEEGRAQGRDFPPTLVVAPTSLMYNWLDEVQRFTPELEAVVVAGLKEERQRMLSAALNGAEDAEMESVLPFEFDFIGDGLAEAGVPEEPEMGDGSLSGGGEEEPVFEHQPDILITTYNMLKRDIGLYEGHHFHYVILDEAQHIKNPGTQNAKSVKRLSADGFFALTGTPIENTLTELWSIFDYLMPGYLLSHEKFKRRYETPIAREQDERAGTDLRRHIMPFILRRLKQDVLKELPDKVERRLTCEMTERQDKVYKAWFLKSRKEFAQVLSQHGFGESKIKILAILTRLRQIACDPSLFLEDYTGGSGKLAMLEEIVGDAVASGHRLLIFSQFTTLLGHIAERLGQNGWRYFYLDGSTPAMERLRLVKSFNAGGVPIFLISLKAGGTGLNLTGADMVIHVDPWWNPAVEDQATDRAYRLGQKNNVQVVKLITKDTVEEKIYELQQKKKDLIDKMIQPGENFLTKLSEEEIRELFSR